MSMAVVWVDLSKAKLFHFSEDCMKREALTATPEPLPSLMPSYLYDEIARRMECAKRVLILGPDVAKFQLNTHMNERFPDVAKRIVGCEGSENPSDQQIAAYAMKFIQKPVA